MCADCWHCYIQDIDLSAVPLHEETLVFIHERTAGFLVDQVIKPSGQFHVPNELMAEILDSQINKWYDASDV